MPAAPLANNSYLSQLMYSTLYPRPDGSFMLEDNENPPPFEQWEQTYRPGPQINSYQAGAKRSIAALLRALTRAPLLPIASEYPFLTKRAAAVGPIQISSSRLNGHAGTAFKFSAAQQAGAQRIIALSNQSADDSKAETKLAYSTSNNNGRIFLRNNFDHNDTIDAYLSLEPALSKIPRLHSIAALSALGVWEFCIDQMIAFNRALGLSAPQWLKLNFNKTLLPLQHTMQPASEALASINAQLGTMSLSNCISFCPAWNFNNTSRMAYPFRFELSASTFAVHLASTELNKLGAVIALPMGMQQLFQDIVQAP